ncbi:hypothetical protein SAMN02745753_02735 [Marinomonas polaris DSM 16579]|uniref:Uncharacterized protein n=1 Tax=Marinomonas polaris DSM 16579 TaxID=1122206 RepID=A0A1M5EYR8_9GAMM|nr:hypothetical protein [Marinomonas polaris]SHF84450.1 hypothetical protein SAMN02745753_02735 [Marinomonas polaris DSM 16579]
MKYKDFLNSARKHKNTCDILKKEVEVLIGRESKNKARIKELTINLYYLSGYVVECSIKYGIYYFIEYDRNKDIKDLDQNGLTFSGQIKNHKFERYSEYLNRHKGDIPLVSGFNGVSKEVKLLYKNWDADVRYLYSEIPIQFRYCDSYVHVKDFNLKAEEIFSVVENM